MKLKKKKIWKRFNFLIFLRNQKRKEQRKKTNNKMLSIKNIKTPIRMNFFQKE